MEVGGSTLLLPPQGGRGQAAYPQASVDRTPCDQCCPRRLWRADPARWIVERRAADRRAQDAADGDAHLQRARGQRGNVGSPNLGQLERHELRVSRRTYDHTALRANRPLARAKSPDDLGWRLEAAAGWRHGAHLETATRREVAR